MNQNKEIIIEGFDLIEEEIKKQHKGLLVLSKLTGVAKLTVKNIRDGKNCLVSSLGEVCRELGLKLVIERDEDADPQPYVRKRNGKTSGAYIVPRKKKIPVPMKNQ